MNYKLLTIIMMGVLLVESCNIEAKHRNINDVNAKNTIVSDDFTQEKRILIEDSDSIFYYYSKAIQLPKGTKAHKILETLYLSKLGSLDFYASNIGEIFNENQLKKISSILIFNVELLFISCEEYHNDIFNENFASMPESAQRADVQSEMNSRKNKMLKSKNILEALLSPKTGNKAKILLLYGNVLYNLYDEEGAEKTYSEYYNIMKKKGMGSDVPEYVTNSEERKMIGEE